MTSLQALINCTKPKLFLFGIAEDVEECISKSRCQECVCAKKVNILTSRFYKLIDSECKCTFGQNISNVNRGGHANCGKYSTYE